LALGMVHGCARARAHLDWTGISAPAVIMRLSDPSGNIGARIAGNLKIAARGIVYLHVDKG
jgi:hypothetical protein